MSGRQRAGALVGTACNICRATHVRMPGARGAADLVLARYFLSPWSKGPGRLRQQAVNICHCWRPVRQPRLLGEPRPRDMQGRFAALGVTGLGIHRI
jgi:hypothetical protein